LNICMIGAGYVGLVSAACFSEFGWTVTCVDKDPQRLAELKDGKSPIYEPGLDDLLQRNMAAISQGRTVIVIAHRLSSVRHADRIIVLDHGRLVEEGTHDTLLLRTGGLYAHLWSMQAGHGHRDSPRSPDATSGSLVGAPA